MILGFSTQLNGKPTHFVEKIQTALRLPFFNNSVAFSPEHVPPNMNFYIKSKCKPKLHTIREDPKDRWGKGNKIDFFINVRKKNMFRFAPVVPVVRTQSVFMTYNHSDLIEISVNGRELFGYPEREALAINDGFDCWEDFFNYFYPIIQASEDKCFSGKIIHWTDFKY